MQVNLGGPSFQKRMKKRKELDALLGKSYRFLDTQVKDKPLSVVDTI